MANIEAWWKETVSGEEKSTGAVVARTMLAAMAGAYLFGLKANTKIYEWGLKRHTQPVLPTVSVGNITLGGAGKTTVVQYLAKRLAQEDMRPGVVLRGHGRTSGAPVAAASNGSAVTSDVAQTGDEAAMLAASLPGVPVAVGKRRERVIELLQGFGCRVALLDDGYQYFRMARLINIVLISALDDLRWARLFPAGVLREPPGHMQRADQVWISHADAATAGQLEEAREFAAVYAPECPTVLCTHAPGKVRMHGKGGIMRGEELAGRRVVAFCGLGKPNSFTETLKRLGAQVLPVCFADHHVYTAKDMADIARRVAEEKAEMAVTTEKDAVKLPGDVTFPLGILQVGLNVLEGHQHIEEIITMCRNSISQ